MANRGLSAGAITELGADNVEFYHLVRMDFSTPLYYTTAPYNITYGGNIYLSSVVLMDVPDVVESLDIKPGTISIGLSGATAAVHALLLSESKNVDVYIYRYLIGVAEAVVLFYGFTDKYNCKEDTRGRNSTVNLTISNHWSNWEASSGRTLSDASQQNRYSGDLGMEYLTITDFFAPYWGGEYLDPERIVAPGAYYGTGTFIIGAGAWAAYVDQLRKKTPNTIQLPVVYGQSAISGKPVFRTVTNGTRDMWVVYALAEGECDSLVDILFDSVSYTNAKYVGYISVTFHGGTTTQTVDTALDAASLLWTSAHRLRGICYVVIKYVYNTAVWSGEPAPLFILKGKKLYDPRTAGTAWGTNPALVLYDYLTSTVYGKGLSSAELDAFNAGADYAETIKVDHDGGLGGTPVNINLFDFNGIIETAGSVKSNAEKILFTMRAHLPWVSGKYTLVIERDDDTSNYSFDDTNITGAFEYGEAGIKDLANVVHYSFVDAAIGYIDAEVIADSASYLSADGNRELRADESNNYESNRYRAQNRAATILKKSRQQISVKLQAANADALQVQTGEVVDITRTTTGWSGKLFRVVNATLLLEGGINFELDEYEASVYDWAVSAETDPPANTQLLDPLDVTAPTSLVLESGTNALILNGDGTIVSRIKATFTASADAFVLGYNVYIKKPTDATKLFYARIQDPATTEIYISPVEDGISYTVYIKAFNSLGVESAALSDSTTVIGKTAVPANVTGFITSQNGEVVVLKWTQVTDADLAGYDIRYGKRGASSYADATPLTSVTRGTNVTSADIPPGDWTIYIKAVDTSGNYSTTAAQASLVVTTALDVIYQLEQSPDWLGSRVNFVKHWTGVLYPESTSTISALGMRVFDECSPDPEPSCSYEAPEIDIDFDDGVRVWAEIDSYLCPGETAGVADPGLQIDYRLVADSYDGFEPWSIGNIDMRYIKQKLVLDTTKGNAAIRGFKPTVDLLEYTINAKDVAISISGETIVYAEQFHVAPFVRVFVKGTSGVYAVINNVTSTSFDVYLFNNAGAVAGTIDWEAEGV
jgi:hypothetical protein